MVKISFLRTVDCQLFTVNWLLVAVSCLLWAAPGCSRQQPASTKSVLPPRAAMMSAVKKGQWSRAWEHFDAVVQEYGDDSGTLLTLARVAHENQQPGIAADMLARACRAEKFRNEPRVQQAMVAMIGVGRLHQGMQLLEEAIEAQPTQDETRRWLYDFYIGTEDRNRAVPHGRILVRQRKFDLEMLLSLSNTERRTQDAEVLQEMIKRNPDDERPRLGVAKAEFDDGNYKESIETLDSILKSHPDYQPAQALLGRALAAANQYDRLERWAREQSEEIDDQAGYWLAIGDWARAKDQPRRAARAYWEATVRDPDVMEAWTKLSTMLQQAGPQQSDVSDDLLSAIKRRATNLSTFNQLKHRFVRTSSISRATAIEIVQALRQLGRLWEAEAWASIATTLPEDDAVDVQQERTEIVAMLTSDTPWQLIDRFPELRADLTNLPVPEISVIVGTSPHDSVAQPDTPRRGSTHFSLINEASERGLKFFGRTGEDLDQPGIMLHETVGCGGGTIDFDLDGWSDLYLAAAGGTPPQRDSDANALMRNVSGSFQDVTDPSGTGDTGFGQGVAVGDVNQDGFPDLLVLNYGRDRLYVNNGDGTFADATGRLGTTSESWSASAAIADINGDGLPEVVIVNYCAGIDPVTTPCPMKDTGVIRSCTPMMFPGEKDIFLKATPNGSLVDQTDQWNAAPGVLGRGLGIVVGSLDDQPGNDVFIANDMTNNHFWTRQPGASQFQLGESAMLRGLAGDDRALAQGSMGIATGDLDHDGDLDVYVTNFDKEYNTLHEQAGQGVWQDRTSQRNLAEPTLPWVGFGAEAVDLDHDGTLELVVSNGHVDMFSRGDEKSIYAHPMQVFRRTDAVYESVAELMSGQYVSTPHVGRALWTLDADRDGLTDVAVTHQTEPVALLMNRSVNVGNWIAVRLVGRDCGRDAIGTVVQVKSGDDTWVAFQTAGDGYLCSNERLLRFGVGPNPQPCEVIVTWPDGRQETFPQLRPNSTWLIVQADSQAFQLD